MKAPLYLIFLCFYHFEIKSQDIANYAYIDVKALQIPTTAYYSADSIAKFVLANFSSNSEKVRAVYKWITTNIRYSKDSLYYFRGWGKDPEEKMNTILRRRKGVCENYAELFAGIVSKCGIQAVVVSGYCKISGMVNWSGHGWCAVKIDNQWLFCDPTWDEGFKVSASYFLVPPEEFIQTQRTAGSH